VSEPAKTPSPFDVLLEQIRVVVRDEIRTASSNGNGNGNHTPSLLSAESAAKLFDVPKTWISDAARRGELPSVRVGHYVRFTPADLQAFIKANRSG
jgi:excisionase family DNA binding protein